MTNSPSKCDWCGKEVELEDILVCDRGQYCLDCEKDPTLFDLDLVKPMSKYLWKKSDFTSRYKPKGPSGSRGQGHELL